MGDEGERVVGCSKRVVLHGQAGGTLFLFSFSNLFFMFSLLFPFMDWRVDVFFSF